MWKREEASKPVIPAPPANVAGVSLGSARGAGRVSDVDVVNVGKSVIIKGELSGSEDLTIEGRVEGQIELTQHVLTIGRHGRIRARVVAKVVVVLGEVVGNIQASDKVILRDSGAVEGDIIAPRVAIAEGARFRGKIDMQRDGKAQGEEKPGLEAKPKAQTPVQAKATVKEPAPATAGH
jgi:cytoskeletal protein CcmA (bactofilin family)